MASQSESTISYKNPSRLSVADRSEVVQALLARLADGIDLHSQIKVAHWNVKGPRFSALHPLFETFAVSLAIHNDTIAERAVTLGGVALGTVRQVAAVSKLPEYPGGVSRDLEHVRLLAERFGLYLDGLREARSLSDKHGDEDTHDILAAVITEFEKHAWFLLASLEE
jgi:starvation-inducible DNA-binding protein